MTYDISISNISVEINWPAMAGIIAGVVGLLLLLGVYLVRQLWPR